MFDDFDLFESCEEYYNDEGYSLEEELFKYDYSLTKEQEAKIDALFPMD